MNRKITFVLWICLAISLIMMYPGLALRLSNENANKSVVTVVDYNEFFKSSNAAHLNFNDVLARLKEIGVKVLAVKETTLADLVYSGDIYAATVGEFLSSSRLKAPDSVERITKFVEEGDLNPSSCLIIADSGERASFLKERLERRFTHEQLAFMEIGGKSYFSIKAELDEKLDVGLGFDENVLNSIREKGFEILLRPKKSWGSSYEYLAEYEKLVSDFGVRYLIFDGDAVAGFPDGLDEIESIIKENNLILGIIEAPSQIRYVEQEGLNRLITGTGYSINRVYSAPDSYLVRMGSEELFYQWIRGVVDRNIRFVYVSPLKNTKWTLGKNIDETVDAVKQLNQFISDKGYHIDKAILRLSPDTPSMLHYLWVWLSLVFAGVLYLIYLVGDNLKIKYVAALTVFGISAGIVLNLVLGINMAKPLALLAAILYPSFSSLMLIKSLKEHSIRIHTVKLAIMLLAIITSINMIGAYTVVSTLSDISYTMNVDLFRGVLVSFASPIVLFMISFVFVFAGYGRIKDYLAKIANSKVTYLAAAIAALGTLAFFIYIARSGNTMGISASSLELRIREILERKLVARPRLKEFLIGYPSVFGIAYLYHRYRKELPVFILGIGAVVGCVSVVNSFCHVFTSVSVSLMRTVYGLAIGTVCGTAFVAALWIVTRLYERYWGKNQV